MKTISIDDDLFLQIDKMATGIFSHSDVVRKLLEHRAEQPKMVEAVLSKNVQATEGSLLAFLHGSEFQVLRKVGERYLAILGWAHKNRPSEFSKVEKLQLGQRKYFARSEAAVIKSGNGNLRAKPVPGSSFWTLVTLDSQKMRDILANVLKLIGCKTDEIRIAVAAIPTAPGRNVLSDLLDGLV